MSVVHHMDAGKTINMTSGQRSVLNGTLERFATQHRGVEIRTNAETGCVYVLVTAADDLGHCFKIGPKGEFEDVGQTEV